MFSLNLDSDEEIADEDQIENEMNPKEYNSNPSSTKKTF